MLVCILSKACQSSSSNSSCVHLFPGCSQTPLKTRKRAAGSSGSAMPSKWLALATSNVDVFRYNPDVRPAPSTLLSSMSAHISHQPSPNAQWQKPHCEDSTLSSDRAARWTVQRQGGTWYQCQQSDLTLQEQLRVYLKVRAHSAKRLLGAHVLMAARACVEMKINERETWVSACVWTKLKGQRNVRQGGNKLGLLFTQCACACACVWLSVGILYRLGLSHGVPHEGAYSQSFKVQHNLMHLLCKWIELNHIYYIHLTSYLSCFSSEYRW